MKKEIFKVIHNKKYNFWALEEDKKLLELIKIHSSRNKWKTIAKKMDKMSIDCIKRYKIINPKIKKGFWTFEEDQELLRLFRINGKNWAKIANNFRYKNRTGKQIRQRYLNFLDPKINRSKFSLEEDLMILKLFHIYKSNWKNYVNHFNHRSVDMIKGRYYSSVRFNIKILNIVNSLKEKNIKSENNYKTIDIKNELDFDKEDSLMNEKLLLKSLNGSFLEYKDDYTYSDIIESKQSEGLKRNKEKFFIIKKPLNKDFNESSIFSEIISFISNKDKFVSKEIFEKIKELSSIEKTFYKENIFDDEDSIFNYQSIVIPEILKEIDKCNSFIRSDLEQEKKISSCEYEKLTINDIDNNFRNDIKQSKYKIELENNQFIHFKTCEETEEYIKNSELSKEGMSINDSDIFY